MELAVAKICDVIFSHNFYNNGIIKSLNIEPTGDCINILYNYQLFFRKSNNGFILLSRLESEGSFKPFIPFNKDVRFSFVVSIDDTAFLSRSDLPINSNADDIFYLTNLTG